MRKMLRRLLSLVVALCVLGGLIVAPTAAMTLVCRTTGLPMVPVLHVAGGYGARHGGPGPHLLCCVVDARRDGGSGVRYVLAARSCCELKPATAHVPPTGFVTPDRSQLIADVPSVTAVMPFPAIYEEAPTTPLRHRQAAPRAPPVDSASPRGPPFFS